MNDKRTVAYFSMEIGLRSDIPTYAGGLGILAGDTIRSAADLSVPMVAVSLLYRQGHFAQKLSSDGWQSEEPVSWPVEQTLTDTQCRCQVHIEARIVEIRSWKYEVKSDDGFAVPVYLLDTDLPQNSAADRLLTDQLYGGDMRHRLCQELVLGMGGVRMLRALGYDQVEYFHMNEGHAALLTLELLREIRQAAGRSTFEPSDMEAVHEKCVFTTHTPVPAGHDQFPLDLVERVIGRPEACGISPAICHEGQLNMTFLALALSHYVNGVAKKHGQVSRLMFAGYRIDAITNGVHAATWVSSPFAELFDHHIPGWRQDNFSFRYALSIPHDELWKAHLNAKHTLVDLVNRERDAGFDSNTLTIGCARRATSYKRMDLLLDEIEELRRISREVGRLQVVFAGKAHPQDHAGKRLIQRIVDAAQSLRPDVKMTYLPDYDMQLAKVLVAGVDIWLNTPLPPLEASGTSGMKASLNGVPSLSILDGWWIEGCIEDVTGWAIGDLSEPQDRSRDARSLYDKLANRVVPMYYRERRSFIEIMRHAIALNGAFFNTQRMLQQYVLKAYFE